MEFVGAAHGVILNDSHLREGLIHDSGRFRARPPKPKRNFRIRRWLALALHGLASRIDPVVRVPDLVYRANVKRVTAGEPP
jgi:hypothetical protein